jgi:hypothetical protein
MDRMSITARNSTNFLSRPEITDGESMYLRLTDRLAGREKFLSHPALSRYSECIRAHGTPDAPGIVYIVDYQSLAIEFGVALKNMHQKN